MNLPQNIAILRREQLKLREQLLRLQAVALVDSGEDIGYTKAELMVEIGKDREENSAKLDEFHRVKSTPSPVVVVKSGPDDHG